MASIQSPISYANALTEKDTASMPLGELQGRACTKIDPSYAQKEKLIAGDGTLLAICIAVTCLFLAAIALITVGAVLSMPICLISGTVIAGGILMITDYWRTHVVQIII